MRLIERRIGLLFAAFLGLFVLVLARATWLQAVRGGELSANAQLQQTDAVTIPGHRGAILERNGRKLAVSEDAATVFATPAQVDRPDRVAQRLSRALDIPREEVLEAIADRSAGFAYIARKIDASGADRVREMELAGIGVLPDSRRVYPEGGLAAQVVGTVGFDNGGLTGLEMAKDGLLGGSDGERRVTLDALGSELERETVEPAERGGDLRLTIDASIQARVEEVLAEIAATHRPDGATAIVTDPRSGDVLAMANVPALEPTDLASASPEQLRNRATGLNYEPGSTFKAFTVAGALEAGIVGPGTAFELPPRIQVADRVIEEPHERGTVTLTVSEILAQSSNVGAVTIGLQLGAGRFDRWVRRFGFGAPTGIDFPGEEAGIVPAPEDYSGSTIGNVPIGQGLAVTSIQMAAAYGAIANGGRLIEPNLVLAENGERVPRDRGRRVISRRTSEQLRSMLEGVLAPGGTASEVSVPGYTLAGKTGTAQKVVDGTYSDTEFVASFVGFAPAEDPKLLATVVVDNPKESYYGGTVAAPAFGEIARFALPYLGIPPN